MKSCQEGLRFLVWLSGPDVAGHWMTGARVGEEVLLCDFQPFKEAEPLIYRLGKDSLRAPVSLEKDPFTQGYFLFVTPKKANGTAGRSGSGGQH